MLKYVVVAAALLISAFVVIRGRPENEQMGKTETVTRSDSIALLDPLTLQRYDDVEGMFVVMFPGLPEESRTSRGLLPGNARELSSQKNSQPTTYSILTQSVAEDFVNEKDERLRAIRKTLHQNRSVKTKIVREKFIDMGNDVAGVEFIEQDTRDGASFWRCKLLVGRRAYYLLEVKGREQDVDSATATSFVNSFTFSRKFLLEPPQTLK